MKNNNLNLMPTKAELKVLDEENIKTHYVKIEVLNMEEMPISVIQGRVAAGGSLSIDGNSSMRRTISLSFLAEEEDNDLSNIDNLLTINKRIRIYEGIDNFLFSKYEDIIWFKLGVFVITNPQLQHSTSGVTISLNCQDKMCLLNGSSGGNLPTSITFDSYNQIIGYSKVENLPSNPNTYTVYHNITNNVYYQWDGDNWKISSYNEVGTIVSVPQKIYDIILTLVCNYGGIPISKIFINDIPLELKQIARFTGSGNLYFNPATSIYSMNAADIVNNPESWRVFSYNDDVGYVYTDFIYPGSLVSSIGDNVCTILDKIVSVLGNYEYFFDIDGNFIFQEIKNYLNNSYDPTDEYRLDNNRKVEIKSNNLSILDNTNYKLDVKSNTKIVYDFVEGSSLISSYSASPSYENIKNDFHVWGSSEDGKVIHYHVAIKKKPTQMNNYKVVFLTENGEYTGRLRLATEEEIALSTAYVEGETVILKEGTAEVETGQNIILFDEKSYASVSEEVLHLCNVSVVSYTPSDWRAELYLQGLKKKQEQIRPDIYEQELLDLFDDIYDFHKKEFKADIILSPNDLDYFFDYIEPVDNLRDYSVDLIGSRIYSYQQDKIKRLYSTDVPNLIMVNKDADSREKIVGRCSKEGQPYSLISTTVANNIVDNTVGYSAQEVMRELLYQYTAMNESISLNCIPIYYLEPNTRISVEDASAGIHGDYVIKSLSVPLGGQNTMSISAIKALERI